MYNVQWRTSQFLEDFTVFYQNVRGFVPFNALGKKILPLDNDKLIEFQAYVFERKPCIVVLNETWLAKDHLDNELFPNDSYRCFRVDRSFKTHPTDLNNPDKFEKRGGDYDWSQNRSICRAQENFHKQQS